MYEHRDHALEFSQRAYRLRVVFYFIPICPKLPYCILSRPGELYETRTRAELGSQVEKKYLFIMIDQFSPDGSLFQCYICLQMQNMIRARECVRALWLIILAYECDRFV